MMQEFFTRERANNGIRVPLHFPDGSLSEHWLQIGGVDSDAFRAAELKAKRYAIDIAQIESEGEKAAAIRKTELECVASLILGWSFEEPLTIENVVKFLTEAPQIADMVNRLAAKRSEFYSKK